MQAISELTSIPGWMNLIRQEDGIRRFCSGSSGASVRVVVPPEAVQWGSGDRILVEVR